MVAVKQEDADSSSSNAAAKPTSSSWRLGEDACARFKNQRINEQQAEDAGRWMLENAAKARESNSIEFVLDSGKTILGQRLWLMARCEYIRQMMSSGMEESNRTGVVRVGECGEGAFVGLLEYIYTGKLGDACLGQDWGELFQLGDLFGMEGMREKLLDAVTRGNVEDAARVAVDRGMRELMEKCVEVLPSAPSDVDEARRVVRVVCVLCENGDGDGWRVVGKGLCAVLGAMRAHGEDAIVQEWGCVALGHATRWSAENRLVVSTKGGAAAIVFALQAHRSHVGVQEHGCNVLARLCADDAEARRGGGGAGDVEAVVEALKAHRYNAAVQVEGCGALMNLCFGNGDNRRRCGGAGGVEAVVEALKAHRANAVVQERGCGALRSLCFGNAENRRRCGGAGGLEAVVEALKAHRANVAVQVEGCGALVTLLTNHAENKRLAKRVVAIREVEAAIRGHPDQPAVQREAQAALRLLRKGSAG